MKRAEVWKEVRGDRTDWCVGFHTRSPLFGRPMPIVDRAAYFATYVAFPTHAAALAHATQAVGLATPPEHREAP